MFYSSLCGGGGYAIRSVRRPCMSVILSICEQDYCKSNEPISLKLGVVSGLTN